MGSSPSRSSTDISGNRSSNDERGVTKDISGQNQNASSSLVVPKIAISAKRLARAKKKELEAAKKKILDEYPELADSISALRSYMKSLEENVEDDAKTKTMSLPSKRYLEEILDFSFEHNAMAHRKLLGDEMASNKGGRIFTEYLRILLTKSDENLTKSSTGLAPYRNECQSILKSVCWNFSDASHDLCVDLGRSGMFKLLVEDFKDCVDKLSNSNIRFNIVLPSLSILHNCAKVSDNKTFIKDAMVLDAVVPYLKADVPEIKMIATMTVAYIIEEKDNEIISTDNSMIKFILAYLKRSLEHTDHKFEGFTAEEIVSGLMHIASNDKNKESIVNEGVLPMLSELLKAGNDGEKTIAAKTVWVLSFSKANQKPIRDNAELMGSLRALSKREGELRSSAAGAMWVLEEEDRLNARLSQSVTVPSMSIRSFGGKKSKITPSPPMVLGMSSSLPMKLLSKEATTDEQYDDSDNEGGDMFFTKPPTTAGNDITQKNLGDESAIEGHIMISYQWSCQKLMIRVKEKLENAGYRVWIDIESMGGSTLQAMGEAVENSAVVLVCMSRKYKDSPNCRTEAEYAYKLGRPLIPIRVERGYQPDGWLGALQGAKLYYDFSNIVDFEAVISKLIKQLGQRGKAAIAEVDGPILPVSTATQSTRPPQSKRGVKHWNSSDIKEWAIDNKITIKKASSLDGEELLYLKRLSERAPEFFYKFVHDRLGVTELRGLLNLEQALETLMD